MQFGHATFVLMIEIAPGFYKFGNPGKLTIITN